MLKRLYYSIPFSHLIMSFNIILGLGNGRKMKGFFFFLIHSCQVWGRMEYAWDLPGKGHFVCRGMILFFFFCLCWSPSCLPVLSLVKHLISSEFFCLLICFTLQNEWCSVSFYLWLSDDMIFMYCYVLHKLAVFLV